MTIYDELDKLFEGLRNSDDCSRRLVNLTTLAGALGLLYYSIRLLLATCRGFRLYVWSQWWCCCRGDTLKYGQWAVITGATDGIGQSMAQEFARRGHSILVIGRNKDKLARTKELLEREPNVGQVETLKIDLSDSSLENYARIEGQLAADSRDIGIMVNNAGIFSDVVQRYANFDLETIRDTVNVNVLATVYFTRLVLPGMLSRQRGLIVNVSSVAGSIPTLYMGVYGSTKTFVNQFSRTLRIEYASHPVDIINLEPGPVCTKLFKQTVKLSKATLLYPSPDDYARSALNGLSTGLGSFAGTWMHALTIYGVKLAHQLGILAPLTRVNMRIGAQQCRISPVAKRKILRKNRISAAAAAATTTTTAATTNISQAATQTPPPPLTTFNSFVSTALSESNLNRAANHHFKPSKVSHPTI